MPIRICKKCGKREMKRTYKSPYCRECQGYLGSKKAQDKKRENNLCLDCGKPAKKKLCPHCNKTVKFYSRCEKCLKK